MTGNDLNTRFQDILPDMWREVCDKGAMLRFRISSGSMMPILNVGDVVKVSRVEPSAVRIGDIVAFQNGPNVLVHRIIARKRPDNQLIFQHRGDNAVSAGAFPADNLIGRVVSVYKEEREIALDTPWHKVSNVIIGLELRLTERIDQRYPGIFRTAFHKVLDPLWRLCQKLALR